MGNQFLQAPDNVNGLHALLQPCGSCGIAFTPTTAQSIVLLDIPRHHTYVCPFGCAYVCVCVYVSGMGGGGCCRVMNGYRSVCWVLVMSGCVYRGIEKVEAGVGGGD